LFPFPGLSNNKLENEGECVFMPLSLTPCAPLPFKILLPIKRFPPQLFSCKIKGGRGVPQQQAEQLHSSKITVLGVFVLLEIPIKGGSFSNEEEFGGEVEGRELFGGGIFVEELIVDPKICWVCCC